MNYGIIIDEFIQCDALVFIKKMIAKYKLDSIEIKKDWIEKCNDWKNKYPVVLPEYSQNENLINTYYFTDRLSEALNDKDVIIIDSGSSSYVVSQAIRIKYGQRFLASGGLGSMGYAIPAAIGASTALNGGRIIVVTGDGSFHMNVQELETIVYNNLPVKIIVFNNNGYSSIKATQQNYFNNRYIGVDDQSGVGMPDLLSLSKVYGIEGIRIVNTKDIDKSIMEMLSSNDAFVCDVVCSQDQKIIPTVYSVKKEDGSMVSKPLEDMFPFLDRDEFFREMIVKPVEE